ncbi:hypothetical protein D3C72_397750 [compost metagenome]
MKKTFLKKLLVAFSAAVLFIYGTIYACGGGDDWGWIFDSNFTPEAFVDKSYSPLFLSSDVFYGVGFDNEQTSRFNDEIIADWSQYLNGKMDKNDVQFFLTDSSRLDVDELHAFYSTKKPNRTSEKWKSKINLKESKVKDFMQFLSDAQTIEYYSTQRVDYWSYDEAVKLDVLTDLKWIKTIEKKYNTTKDTFLKNRYWFQTVKAYFYSNNKENAMAFFYRTEKAVPKNTLYYRALAYLAGIEYDKKNFAKSNYLYSVVFDKCPKMRIVAADCFNPQEEKDWRQSLTMAKSNDEKAALWAVQGYYGDEEQAIEEIYRVKPKSDHLDYLLTRLINRQEIKIDQSFKDKTVQENKKRTRDSIPVETLNLVTRIAKSENTSKPYLWNIAAGYLETLNGNFNQADSYFDKAESNMPGTPLVLNQLRLLRFVNNLSKIDKLNSKNEKTILKDLSWLYNELPKENIENFRYENASQWSRNYLSALYKAEKNAVMAELFVRDYDFYDNETNLQLMKAFLSKESKTEIEKIAANSYSLHLKDINDYQAVKATFANKIPEAIAFMKQADNLQQITFYGNPFTGNIKDCHDCDHLARQKRKYSMIEFLNTIQLMQDNVEQKKDVYTNSLLLGNAFYNITHFGNARLFYEGNIIGSGSSAYDFKPQIRAMITNCYWAKMYYQKAFLAAKNSEQKAKCQYMLAKCQRNEYYNKKYSAITNWWEIENDKVNFIPWQGFKNLKANYSKTKYYQDVIAECGYFYTYIYQ